MNINNNCFNLDVDAVITSYNQGTMILEAVQSLCNQTVLPKRIIIVALQHISFVENFMNNVGAMMNLCVQVLKTGISS